MPASAFLVAAVLLAAAPASAMRELATRHAAVHARSRRLAGVAPPRAPPRGTPGVANCTLNFFEQTIDHFSFATPPTGAQTYQQRFFTYDAYWRKDPTGCVFFYNGNEADVTLYVEHTGLMWENAQALGCRLVFAEHRYYGASMPFGDATPLYPSYMTHEQAAADYATLALALAQNATAAGVPAQPFILFGGSYGGMLAGWLRSKYPAVFAGAIAASAPLAFFAGTTPAFVNQTYWQVVTSDAQQVHGAAPACAANVRAAFAAIYAAAQTPAGLANLSATFQLCTPLQTARDADQMAVTLHLNAWDTMAMGKRVRGLHYAPARPPTRPLLTPEKRFPAPNSLSLRCAATPTRATI
jgi:lysosomal Pro-X carboxypeptidase